MSGTLEGWTSSNEGEGKPAIVVPPVQYRRPPALRLRPDLEVSPDPKGQQREHPSVSRSGDKRYHFFWQPHYRDRPVA